jgi:hypothetical protein
MGTYQLARFARLRFILRGPSAPLSLTLPYELSPNPENDPFGVDLYSRIYSSLANNVVCSCPFLETLSLGVVGLANLFWCLKRFG